MAQMDEHQILPCVRCGYTSEEPQYSDVACRLILTNEPPQSVDDRDEATFLRGEMKRGHDMLASIDKDIAALQVMLDSLQERRKQAQKFVNDHAVILSPIRRIRLPPELLTEIFHFAQPVVDTDVKRGIWRLGRVCSYWRSVLLSSPSLWSSICVQWGRVPIIEEMLSRSGDLLLDITFREDSSTRTMTAEVASSVIRTVITASRRWHRITFQSVPNPVLPLLSQLKGRVPMLVELEQNGPIFPEWLEGAPSLRKLNVCSVHRPSLDLDLPWSNIRDCNVRPLTLTQEHQLLRQCPNLETYTIVSREQTYEVPSDMLCLFELHTLILECYSSPTLVDFLILPHLDHVSVQAVHYTPHQHYISSLRNLLSRSQCFPSKLDIYSKNDVVVPLISLSPFQNLTTLDVTACSHKYSTFLLVLTIRPESPSILLPQLERLYLCFSGLYPTVQDMALLTEMVRSRWHPHENSGIRHRLAFFEFTCETDRYPPFLRGALAPLLVFRDEGLKLRVDMFFVRIDWQDNTSHYM